MSLKPEYVVFEALLRAELGLSRDEIRERRELFLEKGVHWELLENRVLLTPAGAAILWATADLDLDGVWQKTRQRVNLSRPDPL